VLLGRGRRGTAVACWGEERKPSQRNRRETISYVFILERAYRASSGLVGPQPFFQDGPFRRSASENGGVFGRPASVNRF
jgi:hypothetical protein